MVDKTRQVDPGKLTAYERWELPNIGTDKPRARSLGMTSQEKPKPPTAHDIEKIRQQAYESGFEEGRQAGLKKGLNEGRASGNEQGLKEGFSQGLAEGLAAGESQVNETLTKLDGMLSELIAPISKQQSLLEESMLNVSMAVARAVIHRELSLDSSSIKTALNAILNDLPKVDSGFSIRINPNDERYISPILDRYDSAINLKLDETVSPGGCLISSSTQLIDYTIEKRFQKTVQGMLSFALQGDSEASSHEVPSSISSLSDYPSDTLKKEEKPDSQTEQNLDVQGDEVAETDLEAKVENENEEIQTDENTDSISQETNDSSLEAIKEKQKTIKEQQETIEDTESSLDEPDHIKPDDDIKPSDDSKPSEASDE